MSHELTGHREASQANLALVLGVLSVVGIPLLGPAAWVVARDEIKGIEEGLRSPANQGRASTARVLGIIGSVILLVVFTVGLVLLITVGPDIIRGISGRPPDEVIEALGRVAP